MHPILQDIAALDGIARGELLRRGELSPRELLEATISAATALNPQLNAISETLYDSARAEVSQTPLMASPLAGQPMFIKDLFMPVAGARMQNGSLLFKDVPAPFDAEFVSRLRRKGLIIAGTSTAPEFGALFSTESRLSGATRNPWDTTRTPGGSSGGAAALVAARIVPFAHANDGGGSIRVPASCCGLFGLKPTRGRTPIGPLVGEGWAGMGINHAVSISVRDSAALLDCVAGDDPGAPYAAPSQHDSFLKACQRPSRRLRIGLIEHSDRWDSDADCVSAVRSAATLCESLGHQVQVMRFPVSSTEFYQQVFTIIGAQTQNLMNMIARHSGQTAPLDLLEASTRVILRERGQVSGAAYAAAVDWIHALGRRFAAIFQDVDILLSPTLAKAPVKLGELSVGDDASLDDFIEKSHSFSPITALFNATGQPAMSVPLHWNAAGLPIGVHFAAPFGDEASLFSLASELELASPWAHKQPTLSACKAQRETA
ncbi:amidase [Uliginosibacterium sediminicola]|uniref:Amidase n=1 Tax=Uliginosibacterium sediminicola TaxID=2024550 RepID=A0ABU9YXB2_9RHOO